MTKIFIVIAVLGVVVACIASSCWIHARLTNSYRVEFMNVGSERIVVQDFLLFRSKEFSKAGCGNLLPGGRVGCGDYYERPSDESVFRWKNLDTGKAVELNVHVGLPKEFGRDKGSEVHFYIDPNNEKVYVAYEVYDAQKGRFVVVDSAGNPFDIAKVKLK